MKTITHEITKRGEMPDGVKIQIEDWSKVYPGLHNPYTVAAYPVSKSDIIGYFSPKRGQKFRAGFSFPTLQAAETVFTALQSGAATLENYLEYIDNYMFVSAITGKQ